MNIRPIEEKDYSKILRIADKLKTIDIKTGWFTEYARRKTIPLAIRINKGFVAELSGKIIGFITYSVVEIKPYISWLGVAPKFHRKKVGTKLVEKAEEELRRLGAETVSVETPSKEEGMGTSYEGTYKFYEAMGFAFESSRTMEFKGTKTIMTTLTKEL
jgi:predicted N-acetyltransferase YhbS